MGICSSERPNKHQIARMQRSDFVFVSMMGKGSFGSVWKVFDPRSARFYALKIIDKVKCISGKNTKAVMTERHILAHLAQTDTKFIVKLHATFQDERKLYIMMDFIQGDSLRKHLNQQQELDQDDIQYLCSCILKALQCLRANNIIHRDIKPENIIIDRKGEPLLIDFGLASFFFSENAEFGGGSIGYMAPELLHCYNHGFQVDYFSFGILVFELFFKRRPYISSTRSNFIKEIIQKPMSFQNFPQLASINLEASDFIIKMDGQHKLYESFERKMVFNHSKKTGFFSSEKVTITDHLQLAGIRILQNLSPRITTGQIQRVRIYTIAASPRLLIDNLTHTELNMANDSHMLYNQPLRPSQIPSTDHTQASLTFVRRLIIYLKKKWPRDIGCFDSPATAMTDPLEDHCVITLPHQSKTRCDISNDYFSLHLQHSKNGHNFPSDKFS